jgi:hypothetical protein
MALDRRRDRRQHVSWLLPLGNEVSTDRHHFCRIAVIVKLAPAKPYWNLYRVSFAT